MEREQLIERVRGASKDDKISCRVTLKLAEETGISSAQLGSVLNELKIKISGCQLGCFS
jgi:hypothetical protein